MGFREKAKTLSDFLVSMGIGDAICPSRKQVFQKNKAFVVSHNAEYEQGVHSFNLELNHLADLTNVEYQKQMLGFSSDASTSSATTYNAPNGTAPDAWDWR